MKIIISPAKKMKADTETFAVRSVPAFAKDAARLREHFQGLDKAELKRIWKCSDKIVDENVERLGSGLGQPVAAITAYDGIQYQYMAPRTMEREQLEYIDRNLFILSGLYGVLRPFDGIEPYRLEMQARFDFEGCGNLYEFWNSRLCNHILESGAAGSDAAGSGADSCGSDSCGGEEIIVNLASDEYSKAVIPYIRGRAKCINISFLKETDKGLKKEATLQKMLRGEMVRYMAESLCEKPEDIKSFNRSGVEFCEEMSGESDLIFIKKNKDIKENDYSWK